MVNEHNFRADDFIALIVAKDIIGNSVNVEDFRNTILTASNWETDQTNHNIHVITIEFSVDANYSFDYSYKDLAKNQAAEYDEYQFTVDKTSPINLTIS